MSCQYIKSEFNDVPNINKVKFFNSGNACTKTLNINIKNIDYFISLMYQLKDELKKEGV